MGLTPDFPYAFNHNQCILSEQTSIFTPRMLRSLCSEREVYEISVRSMNIDNRPTDDRPKGQFTHFAKISNGHNSATRQPIPLMFGSRVGFSGTADRTVLFPVGSNPRWWPEAILKNFKLPYLSKALSASLCVCALIILCPRTVIYNDGDSKIISQGRDRRVISRPTVQTNRTKRQILRNSRENNM